MEIDYNNIPLLIILYGLATIVVLFGFLLPLKAIEKSFLLLKNKGKGGRF